MEKATVLKIVGTVGTIAGAVCFYLAGVNESLVTTLVGATFIFAGIIMTFFKAK